MRIAFILLLLTLLIVNANCGGRLQPNRDRSFVMIGYDYRDSVMSETNLFLKVESNRRYKDFTYYRSSSKTEKPDFYIRTFPTNDSIIIYENDSASLVDKKDYLIDNKAWTVKKYNHDNPLEYDEESFIYIVDGIGLIAFFNTAWLNYGIMRGNEVAETLRKDERFFKFPLGKVNID